MSHCHVCLFCVKMSKGKANEALQVPSVRGSVLSLNHKECTKRKALAISRRHKSEWR